MFERIVGRRKSIQRTIVKSLIISVLSVIILTFLEFYIFIKPPINAGLAGGVFFVIQKGAIFTVINIILISGILIKINTKIMLQPITQLNEATKKVSARRL